MAETDSEQRAFDTFFFYQEEFNGIVRPACRINYRTLLNLSFEVSVTVSDLRTLLSERNLHEIESNTLQLLQAANWRPHLIACAVMLTGHTSDPIVAAAWDAARQGSWVVPQLVATCRITDSMFATNARNAILDPATRPQTLIAIRAVGNDVLEQDSAAEMERGLKAWKREDSTAEVAMRWMAAAQRVFGIGKSD